MKGLNRTFMSNPVGFINRYTVDNVTWERGVDNGRLITALSAAKAGEFDFEPVSEVMVRFRIKPPKGLFDFDSDPPISAYYCPFVSAANSVGHVDVPNQNPAHDFIFTPAMHGCHLEVTPSPLPGHFRVWHNQHPGNDTLDGIITQHGARISSLVHSDYAAPYDEDATNSQVDNAFNFLYRVGGVWHFLAHPTLMVSQGSTGKDSDIGVRRNHSKNTVFRGAGV